MWDGYGYYEGGQLGKPYDLRLLRRLLPYIRPYTRLLLLTSFLILAAAGADLVLPYLTKIAIDRFIVISYQKVSLSEAADPRLLELTQSYRRLFRSSGKPGLYFLSGENARKMELQDLNRLKAAGIIQPEPYYLADKESGRTMAVIRKHPSLFEQFPEAALIKVEDLGRLGREDLSGLRSGDIKGLAWIALIGAGALLLGFMFNFVQVILLEAAGQRLTHDLRQDLLNHILKQSLAFHDRSPSGRLVARLTNDIQNLNEMIKSVAVTLFEDAFVLIGIAVILIHINLRLALLTFTLLPGILLVSMIFRRRARDVFRDLRHKVSQINTVFGETISGIRVIQAFRREKFNRERFGELNHENYLIGMRQIRVFAVFMPLIEVISATALGLVIWYGGISVIKEAMTLGAVVAFIGYVRKFFQPIRDVAEKYNILQSAMASLERVFGLLDQRWELPPPAAKQPLPPGRGEIRFDQVNFGYRPDEPVLKDVSFSVPPGRTLAIVGATGSGKTSIINLLLRFYEVDTGRILVDGVDIRELDPAEHRSRIGLVMQEVFLFAGTVMENIALSRDGMSPERIKAAARAVSAADFIEALPAGYDQHLGEGGLSLSVGQRQLLSLARVLVQDPQILILDEATAFIDSETEKLIESALARLTAGRTSIIIAHRLSTIRRADRILVLHQGRVLETGTHAELLARQGLYYRLHQFQFKENELAKQPGS